MDSMLLSLLIWMPILGGCLIILIGNSRAETARWLSALISIVVFIMSIGLFTDFDNSTHLMQFTEKSSWISHFDIYYHIGVDGISMPLIILTTFSTILVIIAGWEVISKRVAHYMAAFLMMEGLIIGVFSSLDAVLFYAFWEASLIPMLLIIGT
jgi:NADH-quinone oxidoreductase subunit M